MEPTSEEPIVEMMTTERLTEDISTSEEQTEYLTTEEETTQEEATEPETTRETKLVAEVLNDGLTTDDNLQIKYYFDGPTDVVLWTTGNCYTLEIYEENHWTELKLDPEWMPPIGMGGLSQDMPEILELPLSKIYLDFKPGHYRFTRPLGPHYTYKGENPFGDSISVEFDVTCSEFFVLGQAKKKQIKNTDDLEIIYTIITENEYTCSMQPYYLYVWSNELIPPMYWDTIGLYNITDRKYETMVGSNTIEMTIPLKEYYGDLSPGLYKYMHKIGDKEIGVLFEIVAEEEIN